MLTGKGREGEREQQAPAAAGRSPCSFEVPAGRPREKRHPIEFIFAHQALSTALWPSSCSEATTSPSCSPITPGRSPVRCQECPVACVQFAIYSTLKFAHTPRMLRAASKGRLNANELSAHFDPNQLRSTNVIYETETLTRSIEQAAAASSRFSSCRWHRAVSGRMAGGKPLAFCDAHKAGLCSVAWLPAEGGGAAAVLLTAGPDGRLCYRNPELPTEVVKDITNSCQGIVGPVHVLATSEGRPVVTGDDQNFAKASLKVRGVLEVGRGMHSRTKSRTCDHAFSKTQAAWLQSARQGVSILPLPLPTPSARLLPCRLGVSAPTPGRACLEGLPASLPALTPRSLSLGPWQVYSHPGGEHIGLATRFTLPVRALAYSPSGLNLAVAGDDEGIKLVDMSDAAQGDCRVFRQLAAQASPYALGPGRCLPEGSGERACGQAGWCCCIFCRPGPYASCSPGWHERKRPALPACDLIRTRHGDARARSRRMRGKAVPSSGPQPADMHQGCCISSWPVGTRTAAGLHPLSVLRSRGCLPCLGECRRHAERVGDRHQAPADAQEGVPQGGPCLPAALPARSWCTAWAPAAARPAERPASRPLVLASEARHTSAPPVPLPREAQVFNPPPHPPVPTPAPGPSPRIMSLTAVLLAGVHIRIDCRRRLLPLPLPRWI